jgi:hypothetical protein
VWLPCRSIFTDLRYLFRIGITTVGKIVKEVFQSIWLKKCIPAFSKENWESITSDLMKNMQIFHIAWV